MHWSRYADNACMQCSFGMTKHYTATCSFKLPEHLRLANVEGLVTERAGVHSDEPGSGIAQTFASQIDPSLTWAFVAWLHSITSLPVFIKVLCPQHPHVPQDANANIGACLQMTHSSGVGVGLIAQRNLKLAMRCPNALDSSQGALILNVQVNHSTFRTLCRGEADSRGWLLPRRACCQHRTRRGRWRPAWTAWWSATTAGASWTVRHRLSSALFGTAKL